MARGVRWDQKMRPPYGAGAWGAALRASGLFRCLGRGFEGRFLNRLAVVAGERVGCSVQHKIGTLPRRRVIFETTSVPTVSTPHPPRRRSRARAHRTSRETVRAEKRLGDTRARFSSAAASKGRMSAIPRLRAHGQRSSNGRCSIEGKRRRRSGSGSRPVKTGLVRLASAGRSGRSGGQAAFAAVWATAAELKTASIVPPRKTLPYSET